MQGAIYLNDVLKAVSSGKSLKEISKPLPSFSPETSLLEALARLKAEEESMGLVLEDDKPAGDPFFRQGSPESDLSLTLNLKG